MESRDEPTTQAPEVMAAPRRRCSRRASRPRKPMIFDVKPFRPLLPRPVSKGTSTASPTLESSRATVRRIPCPRPEACGVPQCAMLPCYLNTHRQYTKTFRKANLLRTTAVGVHLQSRTSTPSDHSRSSAQISVRTTPNPEVVFDSLPELPFERPYPKEFPEILHFFVTVTLDRLLLLFRPPWKIAKL